MSVFNLLNTAIFWAFMTDLFTVEQGKRLFGFIAVVGSLGAIADVYLIKFYMRDLGPANLLAISAVMLAVAGGLSIWLGKKQSAMALARAKSAL